LERVSVRRARGSGVLYRKLIKLKKSKKMKKRLRAVGEVVKLSSEQGGIWRGKGSESRREGVKSNGPLLGKSVVISPAGSFAGRGAGDVL